MLASVIPILYVYRQQQYYYQKAAAAFLLVSSECVSVKKTILHILHIFYDVHISRVRVYILCIPYSSPVHLLPACGLPHSVVTIRFRQSVLSPHPTLPSLLFLAVKHRWQEEEMRRMEGVSTADVTRSAPSSVLLVVSFFVRFHVDFFGFLLHGLLYL